MNPHRRSLQLPPELAAHFAKAQDLSAPIEPKVPPEFVRARELNRFRSHIEGQKKEADELLEVLAQDDPRRARLEAYRDRLSKARLELAALHAEVLAPLTDKIAGDIETALAAIASGVAETRASSSPA